MIHHCFLYPAASLFTHIECVREGGEGLTLRQGGIATGKDNNMRKIDWTAKLTSRKFWAAIATFVSMMIVAIGKSEETATQVTSLIMAGAAVVAYIIGEGLADAAAAVADDEK